MTMPQPEELDKEISDWLKKDAEKHPGGKTTSIKREIKQFILENGYVKPTAQLVPLNVDILANFIRRIDGNNDKGAGYLAEQIHAKFGVHQLVPLDEEEIYKILITPFKEFKKYAIFNEIERVYSKAICTKFGGNMKKKLKPLNPKEVIDAVVSLEELPEEVKPETLEDEIRDMFH